MDRDSLDKSLRIFVHVTCKYCHAFFFNECDFRSHLIKRHTSLYSADTNLYHHNLQ